jgi:hypothetical protein
MRIGEFNFHAVMTGAGGDEKIIRGTRCPALRQRSASSQALYQISSLIDNSGMRCS